MSANAAVRPHLLHRVNRRFQVNDRTAFQQPAQSLPKNFIVLELVVQEFANLQVGKSSKKSTCPEHKEAFRYFDTVCKRPICADCLAFSHNGHACQGLATAAARLQSLVERSQTHCSSLEAAAAVAKMREEAEAEYSREKATIGAEFAEVGLSLDVLE